MKMKSMCKKFVTCLLAGTMIVTICPINAFATVNPTSHGSEVLVEEDDLKTKIPSDYDVNDSTQGKAKNGTYQKLFDTTSLQEVRIDIDENNWNYLLQNANSKEYVMADEVRVGEKSVGYVGLKTKGNTSLRELWESDSDRFSFTVNVSKYIKKKKGYSATQNFYGLEKFSLNNVYGDASYLKEYLSYQLMAAMGVATPYCSMVKLYINDEFYGVYTMVENVDESLVKRTLDSSAEGDLYKVEAPGGDLLYDTALDAYLDGTNTFDFHTSQEADNRLSEYSGILYNKQFGTTLEDYTDEYTNAKSDEEKAEVDEDYTEDLTTDCMELFSWMKELNRLSNFETPNTEAYKEEVERIVNVDEVLRYFATNTYLVNLDTYQSTAQQNYAMYLLDGKVSIIPWDYNSAFGGYGMKNAGQMINFSIDQPVFEVEMMKRPLLNVLLQNDEYRAQYESYLEDCTKIANYGGTVTGIDCKGNAFEDVYEANYFATELSNYRNTLLPATLQETSVEAPFYTYDEFLEAVDNLIPLIQQRSLAVKNQLVDNHKVVSGKGIELSKIGTVFGIEAEKVFLNRYIALLQVGKSCQLKAEVYPDTTTYKQVQWSSSNDSVVTIDTNGQLTAVGPGIARIRCQVADNSRVMSDCYVIVYRNYFDYSYWY